MPYTNENDISKFDPDIIGAGEMVITGGTQVACVSEHSRKITLMTHDVSEGEILIKKTPTLEHRVKYVAYSENILYATAPRTFTDPGYIYIFHKNALGAPRAVIRDDYADGSVITQPAISVFIYSRTDRPSIVARDKTTYEVVAEIQMDARVGQIYGDLVNQGTFYCMSKNTRTVQMLTWDEATLTFTHQDPITLRHAEGMLDMIVRDGELLYTTRSHVVHYKPETDTVSFSYHDFLNKFVSIDAVTAIDFGASDDPEQASDDRYGNVQVDTAQVSADSVRGVTVDFGYCPAGDYELEWLGGMPELIIGEFGVMGEAPGIGIGAYQGFVMRHDNLTVTTILTPVTGQAGETSPGKYNSRPNGIAAYTGAKTLFTHTGERMWLELWDADFTDNNTELSTNAANFRLRQLTGQAVPDVPPDSDGIPIDGTGIIIYQHPNLDGNTNVTDDDLRTLSQDRLMGNLSRASRNRFICNPLFEEFGEVYGSIEAPFSKQFQDIGPRSIIRMVNNTFIALDSARGQVVFSGAKTLQLDFTVPSPSQAHDSQYCNNFDFVEQFDFDTDDERIEPVNLPVVRSKVGYPYANAISLPGKSRRVWGEGKGWNNMFFAGDVTVCAWVRSVRNDGIAEPSEDWQRIISNKDRWNAEFGFHLSVVTPDPVNPATNGRIEFFSSGGNVGFPGDPDGYNGILSVDTLPLSDGNWHFVAAVAGIGTGRVYHNGVDVTRLSNAGLVKPSSLPMRIGRISGQDIAPDFFRGDLSGIRVYNTSLPAARILEIFEATRAEFGV